MVVEVVAKRRRASGSSFESTHNYYVTSPPPGQQGATTRHFASQEKTELPVHTLYKANVKNNLYSGVVFNRRVPLSVYSSRFSFGEFVLGVALFSGN